MISRRALIAGATTLSASRAFALTPSQEAVLFNGIKPPYVANLLSGTLPSGLSFARAGQAMQYDATGNLTYAPNNILLNSATLSTQSITTVAGNYIVSMYGTGSIVLSGTATGTITGTGASNQVYLKITATAGTLTLTVSGSVTSAVVAAVTYETTPRPQDQVVTTSSAYYGPRFDYNPNTLAPNGLLIEAFATNLLLNSKADGTNLATQNVTVTAQAYTLSFYGTGTITLSGVSTAGPAVGLGAFPARQTLTFTPTAGTLTLTVTGTVQYAQLETGSFATSFTPTGASPVTRAADIVTFTGSALTLLQGAQGAAIVQLNNYSTSNAANVVFIGNLSSYQLFVLSSNQKLGLSTFRNPSNFILSSPTPTSSNTNRFSVSWTANGAALSANGSATQSTTGTTAITGSIYLGSANGSSSVNGHIASLALYNKSLGAAQPAKTTVGAPY